MNPKDYQFINWFPNWKGIGVISWKNSNCIDIYKSFFSYSIFIGFIEIRKWKKQQRPK